MSISIAFSSSKPCCKKGSKSAIACKFNKASIDKNENIAQELVEEANINGKTSYKCNVENAKQCKADSAKPWWKFWAKKTTNCPCKEAQTNVKPCQTKEVKPCQAKEKETTI